MTRTRLRGGERNREKAREAGPPRREENWALGVRVRGSVRATGRMRVRVSQD